MHLGLAVRKVQRLQARVRTLEAEQRDERDATMEMYERIEEHRDELQAKVDCYESNQLVADQLSTALDGTFNVVFTVLALEWRVLAILLPRMAPSSLTMLGVAVCLMVCGTVRMYFLTQLLHHIVTKLFEVSLPCSWCYAERDKLQRK